MAVTTRQWSAKDGEDEFVTQHEGLVVEIESTYLGDCDSMYYAVYFDHESGNFERHCLGYTPSGAEVDASERVMSVWQAEQEAKQAAQRAAAARHALAAEMIQAEVDAVTPYRGKTVRVVKGRKVPIGTEGTVLVRTQSQYGGYSVKIALADGTEQWTSESNVEVIAEPLRVPVAA